MIDLLILRARQLREQLRAAEADLRAGRFVAAQAKLAAAQQSIDEAIRLAGGLARV